MDNFQEGSGLNPHQKNRFYLWLSGLVVIIVIVVIVIVFMEFGREPATDNAPTVSIPNQVEVKVRPKMVEDSDSQEPIIEDTADTPLLDQSVVDEKTAIERLNLDDFETLPDADGDGLSDGEEILYGTKKDNPDTDGDGYLDGAEIAAGYDPLGPGKGYKIFPR